MSEEMMTVQGKGRNHRPVRREGHITDRKADIEVRCEPVRGCNIFRFRAYKKVWKLDF